MKLITTTIVAICVCLSALAQDVYVKKDIVYKGEQPYCKLVKTSSLIPRFSIRNLADEELIVAKFNNDDQRYTVNFLASGQTCYMKGTVGYGKILAKYLVAYNVIVDGKVSTSGERNFLLEFVGGSVASGLVDAPPNAQYNVVERDRTKLLMVFGNNISQDNKTVGRYSLRNSTENGKLVKVFSFMLPNGEKVADAYVEGINASSARLIILKNNEVTSVGMKSFDDVGMAKEIAEYLIGKYLL